MMFWSGIGLTNASMNIFSISSLCFPSPPEYPFFSLRPPSDSLTVLKYPLSAAELTVLVSPLMIHLIRILWRQEMKRQTHILSMCRDLDDKLSLVDVLLQQGQGLRERPSGLVRDFLGELDAGDVDQGELAVHGLLALDDLDLDALHPERGDLGTGRGLETIIYVYRCLNKNNLH